MAFSDLLGLLTLTSPLPVVGTRIALAYWGDLGFGAASSGLGRAISPESLRPAVQSLPSGRFLH